MKPFEFNETNTFCISLESNPVRWENMQRRFRICDLNVTRFIASNGEDLVDTFSEYLNKGQKGCSQSHVLLYKKIIQDNMDYALILEDDACFDKQWREKINEFCEKINDNDWDLVVLNGSEPIIPSFHWVLQNEQYLTAGYIISKKGAKHILDFYRNCFCSSDWMTTRLQLHGHSYCYFPWLIIQEGKDSNIGEQLEADHEKVINCLKNIDYSLDNYII
jgi:glycosyl transferase family 25